MVTKTKTTKTAKTPKAPKAVSAKKAAAKKIMPASSAGKPAAKQPASTRGDKSTRGGEEAPRLRIRVRAYENKILDASVKQIMDTALRHNAKIVGPVPLPTETKKYTVNRSPFIYKNSREQFEIRIHKRMLDILNPDQKTIESLTNLNLPSGVDIEVTMK